MKQSLSKPHRRRSSVVELYASEVEVQALSKFNEIRAIDSQLRLFGLPLLKDFQVDIELGRQRVEEHLAFSAITHGQLAEAIQLRESGVLLEDHDLLQQVLTEGVAARDHTFATDVSGMAGYFDVANSPFLGTVFSGLVSEFNTYDVYHAGLAKLGLSDPFDGEFQGFLSDAFGMMNEYRSDLDAVSILNYQAITASSFFDGLNMINIAGAPAPTGNNG